jgi:Na+-translocating ferredoxin:NAD+ oxidoreductase subunit G
MRSLALLITLAAISAGSIALAFQSTEARIAEAERRAAQRVLFEIVPQNLHDNDLLEDTLVLPAGDTATLHIPEPAVIHVARLDGNPVAFIIPTIATDGYGGDILLLVGVSGDGNVTGVRAMSHRETPGLGDQIELDKNNWILGFDGKSLNKPSREKWRVKKDGGDFDQFAGATITPRAVVNQVQAVLTYVQEHRAELLARAQTPSVSRLQ